MKEKQEKPTHKSPLNGFTIRKTRIKRCGLCSHQISHPKRWVKGWILAQNGCWSLQQSSKSLNTEASPKHLGEKKKISLLSLYFQQHCHVVHFCTIACGRVTHMWHDFTGNCHFTPFHQIHTHTATSSRWHKSTTLTRLFTARRRRSQWHRRPSGCLLNFIHPSPHSQHINSSLVLLSNPSKSTSLSVSTSVRTGSSEPPGVAI